MKTVIVPVDFSETSVNAAKYAVKFLTGIYGAEMILYHVYDEDNAGSESHQKLQHLNEKLREISIIKTEILAEKGDNLITPLEKLAMKLEADLVIMGITGRSPIGQSLIGSNTLRMVERNICPVLIIPPGKVYSEVKEIMLASDYSNLEMSIPAKQIKNIVSRLHPNLHIMNTSEEHYVALTEEYKEGKAELAALFEEFRPHFHFLNLDNLQEAINQFAINYKIDIIILVHREESLFSRIFGKSNTKKLAYFSTVPILAVHE
jgi:nucleotide-binding universal stress UspA family protein